MSAMRDMLRAHQNPDRGQPTPQYVIRPKTVRRLNSIRGGRTGWIVNGIMQGRNSCEVRMDNRFKITVDLAGDPVSSETLWAERIDGDLYRLLNTPYFAFGFAWGDIVRCVRTGDSLQIVGVEQHSGNSTLRIYFADNSDSPGVQYVLSELVLVGCRYERGADRLVAINVPPDMEVPFSQMCNFLNDQSEDVIAGWEAGKEPMEMQ